MYLVYDVTSSIIIKTGGMEMDKEYMTIGQLAKK